VSVSAAPTPVPATAGAAVSVPLATVTGGTAGDYQATVNWGDGSPAATGVVSASSRGVYSVSG
jgi:hypothetical protein